MEMQHPYRQDRARALSRWRTRSPVSPRGRWCWRTWANPPTACSSAWLFRAGAAAGAAYPRRDRRRRYDRREGVVWVHLNVTASPAKRWMARLPAPAGADPRGSCSSPTRAPGWSRLGSRDRRRDRRHGRRVPIPIRGASRPCTSTSTGIAWSSTRRRPVELRLQARPGGPQRPDRAQHGRADGLAAVLTPRIRSRSGRASSRARPTAARTRSWRATPRCRASGWARRAGARHSCAARWRCGRARSTGCAPACPRWIDENDRFELLDALDRMETLVDELQAIEQREAGLEAEVAARLSEETNRNLLHPVRGHRDLPADDPDHRHLRHERGRPARASSDPSAVLVGDAGDGGGAGRLFLAAMRWRGRP